MIKSTMHDGVWAAWLEVAGAVVYSTDDWHDQVAAIMAVEAWLALGGFAVMGR